MKQLKDPPSQDNRPKPPREPVPSLDKPFKGFIVPEIPAAKTPGAQIVDLTVECIVREALSLGLSLQSATTHVRSTLEAYGLCLSPDEVSARIRSHALTYS
ncbi:MAG TPA: hypothetical protein VMM78_00935, partial [Thermomicrobiales bacterium]|nr:hypothetical protein [Thermomicrobiales bacterium]